MRKISKPSKSACVVSLMGDIVATKNQIVTGSLINDIEVETKTEYIFYSNGKILSKSYRNNSLYSVSLKRA